MNTPHTRDDIFRRWPLVETISKVITLQLKGQIYFGTCPWHDDNHPSFQVDPAKGRWDCFPCDIGGTIIDFMAKYRNMDPKVLMPKLFEKLREESTPVSGPAAANPPKAQPQVKAPSPPPTPKGTFKRVATYDYLDELGDIRFYIDRLEDGRGHKEFKQWHKDATGNRINSIKGIQRVLYRLPAVLNAEEVYLAEGEKCVHALEELECIASTNPGGSSGWLSGYAESLKDKHVVILPDSDEAGQKWKKAVVDSLMGKCASLVVLAMPEGTNDIADLLRGTSNEEASDWIITQLGEKPRIERGVDIPIYSSQEMQAMYIQEVKRSQERCVDLSKWAPILGGGIRMLGPGDMVTILADTGVGKSAILQNIGVSQRPLPTLFFEIELPGSQMSERFAALTNKIPAWEVERAARAGSYLPTEGWDHIYTCPQSKMDLETMEEYITMSALKIGQPPALIMVDYIGLMSGGSGKRYERMSTIAEGLKVMAKTTKTVMMIASQIHRKEGDAGELYLHDAKDSGSIENSSQLVLGAWKENKESMVIKKLKDTKGGAGQRCMFDFHGPTLSVIEREEIRRG